jgi:UDP-2,4-diacetamido-2,4,6-trideoxy-beta-L-altropyranose hydrolase
VNILFRCDGSTQIGMGHVVRCLALADHLKNNFKCDIKFLMRKSKLGINAVNKRYGVLQSEEENFEYTKWLIDSIKKTNSSVLVLDCRDGISRKTLALIKKQIKIKIVTIDDPEDKRLEADLVFSPPVPQLRKMNWDGFGGQLHVGWEYVLLRKEFLKEYPKPKNLIPNILISMGATDKNNITEIILKNLNKIQRSFKVIIVVGSGYPHLQSLEKKIKKIELDCHLVINPENMAKVISQVDFAIISFGQTAYELASLKIPAFYICHSKDHFESSKLFIDMNLGLFLDYVSNHGEKYFLSNLNKIMFNKDDLKRNFSFLGLKNISNLDKVSKIILN